MRRVRLSSIRHKWSRVNRSGAPTNGSGDQPPATGIRRMWNGSKLQALWKEYGILSIGLYLGVYAVTLTSMIAGVRADVIPAKDALAWVSTLPLAEHFVSKETMKQWTTTSPEKKRSLAADVTIAWILTKFTEPIRMIVTAALLPYAARVLRPLMRKKMNEKLRRMNDKK